jgi:hypothetical protein
MVRDTDYTREKWTATIKTIDIYLTNVAIAIKLRNFKCNAPVAFLSGEGDRQYTYNVIM